MNIKSKNLENKVVLFTNKNGEVELRADIEKDTLWATQGQIVRLFSVHQSVVSRHIRNIIKDGEIDEKSNMQKMHNTNSYKPTLLYSLDVILAVGYRTNSKMAIEFRKWATRILREYVTKGYSLNRRTIQDSKEQFNDLRQAIDYIETETGPGKVKAKIVVKLTKNVINQ